MLLKGVISVTEEIKARAEAATPAPWYWEDDILCAPEPYYVVLKPFYDDNTGKVSTCIFDNDKEFIAHAREDIPALIAENERLQKQLDAAVEVVFCKDCQYRETTNCITSEMVNDNDFCSCGKHKESEVSE